MFLRDMHTSLHDLLIISFKIALNLLLFCIRALGQFVSFTVHLGKLTHSAIKCSCCVFLTPVIILGFAAALAQILRWPILLVCACCMNIVCTVLLPLQRKEWIQMTEHAFEVCGRGLCGAVDSRRLIMHKYSSSWLKMAMAANLHQAILLRNIILLPVHVRCILPFRIPQS